MTKDERMIYIFALRDSMGRMTSEFKIVARNILKNLKEFNEHERKQIYNEVASAQKEYGNFCGIPSWSEENKRYISRLMEACKR